jgi:hypothetical protein
MGSCSLGVLLFRVNRKGVMTVGIVIVASIEQSTMASTWTEHLCLHRTAGGKWCLDIRGYEVIGEASEYQNEEGDLPDQIDGQDVIGTEDGFVIVDNLVLHQDDYPIYEFDKFSADEFEEIFSSGNAEWCENDTIQKIRQAYSNLAPE